MTDTAATTDAPVAIALPGGMVDRYLVTVHDGDQGTVHVVDAPSGADAQAKAIDLHQKAVARSGIAPSSQALREHAGILNSHTDQLDAHRSLLSQLEAKVEALWTMLNTPAQPPIPAVQQQQTEELPHG
jgi:hypothetical protein